MEDQLAGRLLIKMVLYQKNPYIPPVSPRPLGINIAVISAVEMHYNLQTSDNKVFCMSLYKIDWLLKSDQKKTEELLEKVLKEYYSYLDVFFKAASDTLAPYHLYNHKIKLESLNNLEFLLLYKITTEELETVKQYLLDNLYKRFIKLSQSLFTAPVLFIKKPNRSLQFCIDF
jgi:hypothetical protein